MKALKFAAAAMLSVALSGCLSTNAIYEIGYNNGKFEGYENGFNAGVDAIENIKYAASEFNSKYEQFDFNSIKFFYMSACQREMMSRSVSDSSKSVLGLSLQSKDRKSCAVFFQKPGTGHDERMTTLGHEVAHCIYGPFHTADNKVSNYYDKLPSGIDAVFPAFLTCNDVSEAEKERLLDAWKSL